MLTKDFEIYIIELGKFKKHTNNNKELDAWIKFIKNPEEIDMSDIKNNEPLEKAKDLLEGISDPDTREYILLRQQMARMDKKAEEDFIIDKSKKKIAKKMLENKIDIETIISCTELTKEEIEELTKTEEPD